MNKGIIATTIFQSKQSIQIILNDIAAAISMVLIIQMQYLNGSNRFFLRSGWRGVNFAGYDFNTECVGLNLKRVQDIDLC